jgi:putative heme transporter
MNLPRFLHRARSGQPLAVGTQTDHELQLEDLSTVFAAPRWLHDLGLTCWLLVGVAALIFGLVWLLGATAVIVEPVVAGAVLATVAMPVVHVLERRNVPRALGALLVLLALAALGVVILLLVLGGIVGQGDEISAQASAASEKAEDWLKSAGVDSSGAASAKENVDSAVPSMISTLVNGVISGISEIASLAFAVSFALLSIFFLLKDGPSMRVWVDRHLGIPHNVATLVTGNVILSLRRYFGGVTIVAAFNGVVVGLGALLLDVPLAGSIAVVTFVTAYVPYIGAFAAGAFAVIIALGAQGTTVALIMLVIVLLANGLLQNIVQPIAFGATLRLNPLVVLIVTIGAGSLFGMIGLILAAPLTSAGVQILGDLATIRAGSERAAQAATGAVPHSPGEPGMEPG